MLEFGLGTVPGTAFIGDRFEAQTTQWDCARHCHILERGRTTRPAGTEAGGQGSCVRSISGSKAFAVRPVGTGAGGQSDRRSCPTTGQSEVRPGRAEPYAYA
jgi:hypothetical protein